MPYNQFLISVMKFYYRGNKNVSQGILANFKAVPTTGQFIHPAFAFSPDGISPKLTVAGTVSHLQRRV